MKCLFTTLALRRVPAPLPSGTSAGICGHRCRTRMVKSPQVVYWWLFRLLGLHLTPIGRAFIRPPYPHVSRILSSETFVTRLALIKSTAVDLYLLVACSFSPLKLCSLGHHVVKSQGWWNNLVRLGWISIISFHIFLVVLCLINRNWMNMFGLGKPTLGLLLLQEKETVAVQAHIIIVAQECI